MTGARIFIAIVVPIWSCLFKWLVVGCGGEVFPTAFGIPVAAFDPAKQFRLLGWDLANASLGLFLAAIVNNGSQFRTSVSRAGEFDYLVAIFGGVAFLVLYGAAAFIRYAIMEAVGGLSRRRQIHRFFWSQWLWLLGLLLLWSTSWLAVRAG